MSDDDYIEPRDEDFLIRVRPGVQNGEWTGAVDISIVASANSGLDDESYGQLMHFCTMMCATVPMMEQDESLRQYVHEFAMASYDEEEQEAKNNVDITHENGNVIRLHFNTPRTMH